MPILLALLLFGYGILCTLGVSALVGAACLSVGRGNKQLKQYQFIIGFSVFPVLITYAGFAGLTRIPWLVEVLGCLLAAYGLIIAYRFFASRQWQQWRSLWWCAVPAVLIMALFINKSGMLLGGFTHGDEVRSMILTNTLATNYLKPAFVYDFSLPIVYPYYLFQTSAFLYRSAGGLFFPTIPLLAVTVCTVTLFFYVLYLLCQALFPTRTAWYYTLLSAMLAFAGNQGLHQWVIDTGNVTWRVNRSVFTMNEYLHAGYHYLWGGALGLLSLLSLWRFCARRKSADWLLFVAFLCLSEGFSGMLAVWAGFGAAAVLLCFLFLQEKQALQTLPRLIAPSALIGIVIIGPQLFNALPRVVSNFSLSHAHFWFPRTVSSVLGTEGNLTTLIRGALFGPEAFALGAGLLPVVGMVASLVLAWRWLRRERRFALHGQAAFVPFALAVVAGMGLLTFTNSTSWDWHTRGSLFVVLCAAIVATGILGQRMFVQRSRTVFVLCALALTPQLISFVLERTATRPEGAPPAAVALNEQFPLGTVFFRPRLVAYYDQEPDFDLIVDIAQAGRVLVMPTAHLHVYLNHPSVLARLGVAQPDIFGYHPCRVTPYGRASPHDVYLELSEDGRSVTPKRCGNEDVGKPMAMPTAFTAKHASVVADGKQPFLSYRLVYITPGIDLNDYFVFGTE